MAWIVKHLPAMQESQGQSLALDDPLEKEMAIPSSTLAWESPMDRAAWQATVHGVSETQTQLRD